ncbi:MAG: tRNA (guanosine(18)-2'-O)-methyltransferase TrmH [Trueperaceae bacterium]
MTMERYQKVMAMLHKRQPDLTILAEDVHKPHNLSAMLRSCDAVGIGKVHATNPTGGIATFNETSASAEKWVNVHVHPDIDTAMAVVKGQGMQLFAAHFSDKALDYRDVDYTKPTCILFGNEKWGVSEHAAEAVDAHVIIPMLGMVPSLNVSVATAIILFEAQRQRRLTGFYDTPRSSEAELQEEAFWLLHPKEAALYKSKGQAFPGLNDAGFIVEQV